MGKFIDLTGRKFGRLTVMYLTDEKYKRCSVWHCKCDCSNELNVATNRLTSGNTKSCGCLKRDLDSLGGNRKKDFNNHWINGDTLYFTDDKGNVCEVDIEDFDKIKNNHWHKSNTTGYWYSHISHSNRKIELHRVIMNTTELGTKVKVDHYDRNKNNNKKSNLSIVNSTINSINSKSRTDNTSGIIGVSKYKDKWQAHIQINYKQKNLGIYENINDAIIARLNAEFELFGKFAPQRNLFEQYGIGER